MEETDNDDFARLRSRVAPHRVYPDFLSDEEHAALLGWAIAEIERYVPSRVRGGGERPDVRRSLSLRDLGATASALKARLRALAPRMLADLRMTPFEVAGIELELISHGDGDYFHRHIDTMTGGEASADRAITAIYYFHRPPRAFGGGALRLYGLLGGDHPPFADIEPAQNTLLAFPAWAPHEVTPVSCPSGARADSRFSVNCWLYRRRTGAPSD
jgi:Rps23 Pro-64 3,4-dihydroxylase Tpa1-like proline 4-hydroxylase